MTELQEIRDRLRNLIVNTCNRVGCDNCPYKYPRDEQGNACSSDYLMMLEHDAEQSVIEDGGDSSEK